ncbi:MAG: Asp-tRNA(Asn)/Glu-tRNA(Gln) amidotransferase GatCAB subunit B [Verrucomicrobiales bacterium]|jgi:aspartyl-tRNA(Asn)/glutamyl-tRNA(Gln) amidotransferase subunit B|nr:Asp-tRNA(Asn)/Glu-tRNA(Gln) amidotransferase GatCAB subunit B [Verrucomicrobiales bacterium]|tara:strand:+ start:16281 stop:17744 length:1464 start_codon:yes stop_codon:yes gene_type:complete
MGNPNYIVTIGLEVHVQLKTESKMFCSCPVKFGEPPNTLTCPTCLGLPGALPVLNRGAIESTVLTGQLLGCITPEIVKWDRKNYFYPDMPKNYQISQFDLPLCLGGGVPLYELAYPKDHQKNIENPGKVVELTRIHLEEDVAKSTHHSTYTTIDFNRAGTPLMEIVSEPDIDSAEEAVAYLNSLRQILVYSGVSDADMEKGQMRCDVNISVRPKDEEELGTKIELKNLNSVSAVRRSLHYEVDRQIEELEAGNTIIQATWRWNDELSQTEIMRTKEDAHDYRYFPDPDLLPIRTCEILAKVEKNLPELPHQKVERFENDYQITHYDASVLASEQVLADFYEKATQEASSPKKVANWVINNLLAELNGREISIGECPVEAGKIGKLVGLIESGQISNSQAKEVFAHLFDNPDNDPVALVKEKGFEPADSGAVEGFIDEAISANPGPAVEVAEGNDKAANFLTGQVMKLSRGKANPRQVTEMILSKLRP